MRTRKETYSAQSKNMKRSELSAARQDFPIWGKIREKQTPFGLSANHHDREDNDVQAILENRIQSGLAVINVTEDLQAKNVMNATNQSVWIGNCEASENGVTEEVMKSVRSKYLQCAAIVIFSLSAVFGQDRPKLDIQIVDQKVNMTKAEKRDTSKLNYSPGDTIRYVITASNVGAGLMTEPEIVDPIPAGVTYIPGSASGESTDISFSLNQGGTYMAWPPYYTVRNSKGILIKREATPDMISHIKWNIQKDLKADETATMEFLVKVND